MAPLQDAEKGYPTGGSKPIRQLSLQVAGEVQNPEQYTQRKRPWRTRVTPFTEILFQEYRGDGSEANPFIISWLPNDAENPQTWKSSSKWIYTMTVAVITLAVALASSAYSGATKSIIATFGVDTEIAILGVSLFVLGFAIGPLLWAPCSEVFGRRVVLLVSYVPFTLFNGVAAASPNMAALVVFRFLAGCFGSSPLTNAGGTISDMFNAKERGLAMAIFAAAPFLGPSLGPITGGFIGLAGGIDGWRYVQIFLAAFTGVLTIVAILFVPETYAPTILRTRAKRLSKVTGKKYRAPMDAEKELDVQDLFKVSITRPWKLLFLEPIVLIISIYMAIVYGVLYMLFAAFPIVFQQGRGWNSGVGGLAFLGVLVGMMLGVAYTIFYENNRYIRVTEKRGGRAPPEARLPPSMLGGAMLVIGLAWFAATNGPSVHFTVPIIAGGPFGFGMLLVFLSLMNYLIDSYTVFAASVLAANSVLRSLFGAIFPLFTTYMYRGLGIHWASAIPGFLALICLPFPFLFYKYGAGIRKKCKYTREAEEILEKMMANGTAQAKKPDQGEAVEDAPDVEAREELEAERDAENYPPVDRADSLGGRTSSEGTLAEETPDSQNPKPLKAKRVTP